MKSVLTGAIAATMLLTMNAFAQVSPGNGAGFIDAQATNELLGTDIVGHIVYNHDDEALGVVVNFVFGTGGQLTAVLIGTAGFTTSASKDVALPFAALEMVAVDGGIRLVFDASRDAIGAAPAYSTLAARGLQVELAVAEPAAEPAPAAVEPAAPEPAAPAAEPAAPAAPAAEPAAPTPEPVVDEAALMAQLMRDGAASYRRNCQPCHGNEGQGGAGPVLVNSGIVRSSAGIVAQILVGMEDRGMPGFARLSDNEIAAIATFVRNSWGNDFGLVEPALAAGAR